MNGRKLPLRPHCNSGESKQETMERKSGLDYKRQEGDRYVVRDVLASFAADKTHGIAADSTDVPSE